MVAESINLIEEAWVFWTSDHLPTLRHIVEPLEQSQIESFIRATGKLAPAVANFTCFRELLLLHGAECFFESHIISELGILSGITTSDLTKILRRQVSQDDPNSPDFFSRFRTAVMSEAQVRRRSRAIAIQPASHLRTIPERWEDIELWRSDDERFAVNIVGLLPANETVPVSLEPHNDLTEQEIYGVEKRNLYISIEGVSTEGFFDEFCSSVRDVLSTLVRCLTLLNDALFPDLLRSGCTGSDFEHQFVKFKNDYASASTISKDGVLTSHFYFVKHALELFFLDASTKRHASCSGASIAN